METTVDPASGVTIIAALFAGAVSFLSPCVLPLVPGYLAAVTGVAATDLENTSWRKVLPPSLLFILSFSLIFMALGVTAVSIGDVFRQNQRTFEQIAGIVIIVMGAFFFATLFITKLNREWRVDALMARAGKGGPLVAGAAFAVAWTPCVGPTLTAILSAAALSDSVGNGAFLLGVYSAGLAIPFLLTSVAFTRMTTAFAVVKRHYRSIMAFGGVVLVVMGVLIFSGELFQLNVRAQEFLDQFGLNFAGDV